MTAHFANVKGFCVLGPITIVNVAIPENVAHFHDAIISDLGDSHLWFPSHRISFNKFFEENQRQKTSSRCHCKHA